MDQSIPPINVGFEVESNPSIKVKGASQQIPEQVAVLTNSQVAKTNNTEIMVAKDVNPVVQDQIMSHSSLPVIKE